MASAESLLEDMRNNPKGVRFEDALKLAKSFFGEARISGSHHIFKTLRLQDTVDWRPPG